MYQVERDMFEAMVEDALATLPPALDERIDNLDVGVEDRASAADARSAWPATLLGVYRGVPLTRRTSSYGFSLPDRIVIFQEPLEALAGDEADLRARVRHTVLHEIAHHFGISDRRLLDIGAY